MNYLLILFLMTTSLQPLLRTTQMSWFRLKSLLSQSFRLKDHVYYARYSNYPSIFSGMAQEYIWNEFCQLCEFWQLLQTLLKNYFSQIIKVHGYSKVIYDSFLYKTLRSHILGKTEFNLTSISINFGSV